MERSLSAPNSVKHASRSVTAPEVRAPEPQGSRRGSPPLCCASLRRLCKLGQVAPETTHQLVHRFHGPLISCHRALKMGHHGTFDVGFGAGNTILDPNVIAGERPVKT